MDLIEVIRINGARARELVASNKVLVIDVRSADEFASDPGIPGAINAPWPKIKRPVSVVERHIPIMVYCDNGARSRKAAEVLLAMGFETVYTLGPMRKYFEP